MLMKIPISSNPSPQSNGEGTPQWLLNAWRWTTQDELIFVRHLAATRQIESLRNYLRTARVRKWSGDGMAVDAQLVILTVMDLLDDLVNNHK